MTLKRILPFLLFLFSITNTGYSGVAVETANRWVEFKPETVYVVSLESIADYIYLIGDLRDGTKIAFQAGAKTLKSDDKSSFKTTDYIYFADKKCSSISDLTTYGNNTWYKIYIGEWRKIVKDDNNSKIVASLATMSVKYMVLVDNKKDNNTLISIKPVSGQKLKLIR